MVNLFYNTQGVSIFNFNTFVTALALLIIVYTVTDVRYQFRIAITPIPLYKITFYLIVFIGFGTLITDIWFSENWPIPDILNNQAILQGFFGAMFLAIIILWMYFAFINPPIFGKFNYEEFVTTLLKIIVKGSEKELTVIADELGRSAHSIIKFTNTMQQRLDSKDNLFRINEFAYDLLLLIGNRKLCYHIVVSAPGTAIEIFRAIESSQKYDIPLVKFPKNISTEAILNEDSILYHEDDPYSSGLIGRLKPFTQAIYGNYALVESIRNLGSPFDIDYKTISTWNSNKLKAYCRCVLVLLENYLKNNNWPQHSYVLARAFEKIQKSTNDLYKLDNLLIDSNPDIVDKLNVTVNFITHAVDLLHKYKIIANKEINIKDKNLYDQIANTIFSTILNASNVKSPPDTCWMIQYVSIWGHFSIYDSNGWEIIHYKLSRILYNEIHDMDKCSNYKSAKILGFCLNIMGLTFQSTRKYSGHDYYRSLHKVILKWVVNNYLHLREKNRDIAEACLIGGISFDENQLCLVKTFFKGLDPEPRKTFLILKK